MSVEAVPPQAHLIVEHLQGVEACEWYTNFDDVPGIGTEVVVRWDLAAGVWSAGRLLGYLPPRHDEAVRNGADYAGVVIWSQGGCFPAVMVQLMRQDRA